MIVHLDINDLIMGWSVLLVSFICISSFGALLRFDVDGLKEVHSKFFSTLKNTYNFFAIYANADNIDPREFNVDYNSRTEIDKWLLSKYNNLVKYVNTEMDIII